jgi:hypothetical protein
MIASVRGTVLTRRPGHAVVAASGDDCSRRRPAV